MTLAKTFKIVERVRLKIRMEARNPANSFIGGMPNAGMDSSQFGRVTAQRPGYRGRQFQCTGRFRR